VQQGFLAAAAHFPGHPRKWRDTAPVFAHLDDSGSCKFLQAGLQFSGEFHELNYN
jgi:hypothetical protein